MSTSRYAYQDEKKPGHGPGGRASERAASGEIDIFMDGRVGHGLQHPSDKSHDYTSERAASEEISIFFDGQSQSQHTFQHPADVPPRLSSPTEPDFSVVVHPPDIVYAGHDWESAVVIRAKSELFLPKTPTNTWTNTYNYKGQIKRTSNGGNGMSDVMMYAGFEGDHFARFPAKSGYHRFRKYVVKYPDTDDTLTDSKNNNNIHEERGKGKVIEKADTETIYLCRIPSSELVLAYGGLERGSDVRLRCTAVLNGEVVGVCFSKDVTVGHVFDYDELPYVRLIYDAGKPI
ncbi:hypothetical protein F5Y17DRAFT_461860 [Xylariaceae sp. FL0594]|nr:hypothetical protein F5Y17DRAFT_461860 [Xylariaceae sp. FL0594]